MQAIAFLLQTEITEAIEYIEAEYDFTITPTGS